MTWLRRHPAAAAALVYAALSVLLYAPALLPGHTLSAADYLWTAAPWASERPSDVRVFGSNYELVDSAVQFQPWLEYTRERLPDVPLWNPQIGSGRPFLANAQSAILSPFSWPAFVLPFWWSLGVIGVLKAFAAAFGTFLLGRALGMRFGGALLAGLVYAFCLYLLVWESWPQTNVWALAPWLWLVTERAIQRPRALPVAALAVVVALQFFGGHPESNFHLLAATVVFFCIRLAALRREGRLPGLRAPIVGFAAGVVGGAALAAVTLVPFLELLLRSSDVDVRQGFSAIALPKQYLLGFALYDYWGRATHTAVEAFAQERALYAGALTLVLAGAALIVRPTFQRICFALFCAFLLAVVLGVQPVPEIASHLPVIKAGNHLRVVFILMLCLALLAGWGLDELSERIPPRRDAVLALGLGLLVLPVVILLARDDLTRWAVGRRAEGLRQPVLARAAAGRARAPHDPDGLPDRLARLHGPRRAAAGRAPALAHRRHGVRRARAARSSRPICSRRGWALRRRSRPRTRSSPPRRASSTCTRAASTASSGWSGRSGRRRSCRTCDALGPLRRAQLRPAGRAPLRPTLAPSSPRRRAG